MGNTILQNDAPVSPTNPLSTAPTVSATSGPSFSKHKLIALNTTNPNLVKAGAARLIGGQIYNVSAAIKFFKLYDKATAPTIGTDTPILTIPIPAASSIPLEGIMTIYGLAFTLGLGYGLTGAAADADTTALTAGDVIVNLLYL